MSHPYQNLPPERFWRTGVAECDALQISGLWQPKFAIKTRSRIVTAGSCFAQHFSRALVARGYRWTDFEPGPATLTDDQRRDYNYGIFSCRTGNIYTPRMLLQWLSWALGAENPPEEVWEDAGRFYDPFRPAIEPDGFASPEELFASRAVTLAAIRLAVAHAHVFVFTMGLTESWQNGDSGAEYATCPGTIAGRFDPARHQFVNHRFSALQSDLAKAIGLMQAVNSRLNILLTVSPVPLTATATGQHVLSATSHSKALLRAVAAEACEGQNRIDYFPSYEIITHPVWQGRFFAPNKRSVLPEGVAFVMENFFRDQAARFGAAPPTIAAPPPAQIPDTDVALSKADEAEELRCEEEILAAFAPR
ncbi:MAG TPA: GSCFA domain-containing protein [Paracoccaceae bacterium]|nr:GSCFA domain-containing protein [Paracoccaceae bacterium]